MTDKGIELVPIFLAMIDWAETYDTETEVPADFIQKFRLNSEEVEQEIQNSLKDNS